MKVAFTTSGNDLNAPLVSQFGRAPKFLVYNLDEDTFEILDNQKNVNAARGAGIDAASTLTQRGVNGIVTGYCGPNAYRVLSAAGVKVYYTYATTLAGALKHYRSGKLSEA
ncbi:MAG: NifB/NifX family molybdenum-iron cluster-binding protein [Deltaproteobacteria bacterium]|nr:NifB/NifX family molybdenum-iron cluster-binding protein [Deltaproteobacteria bacterium]